MIPTSPTSLLSKPQPVAAHPDPTPARRTLHLLNELMRLSAPAGGLRAGTGADANALRQQLRLAGAHADGHAASSGHTEGNGLSPATAAVYALANSDAGITHLRAWAALAQLTRIRAAQAGEPLGAVTFFGASYRAGQHATELVLWLPGAPGPLLVPALDLTAYPWPHLNPRDRRPALQAALDVGALWQYLPATEDRLRALGHMAVTLLRLIEHGQPPVAKRVVLSCAAMELHRAAGLRRVPLELWQHNPADMPDAVRDALLAPPAAQQDTWEITPAVSPATTDLTERQGSVVALTQASNFASPAASDGGLEAETHSDLPRATSPSTSHDLAPRAAAVVPPNLQSSRLSFADVAARTPVSVFRVAAKVHALATSSPGTQTPVPELFVGAAGEHSVDAHEPGPPSAPALTAALETVAAAQRPHLDAAAGPELRDREEAFAPSRRDASAVSTPRAPDLIAASATAANVCGASPTFEEEASPDRAAAAAVKAPASISVSPAQQAEARLQAELRALADGPTEAAWEQLASAPRTLAPHLGEDAVLRLLAAPPSAPLPASLVAVVELWLRRLAAQPALAASFLAYQETAVLRWSRERPLLRELGRLVASWSRQDAPIPGVKSWLEAAATSDRAEPLAQTLRDVALNHPLFDETLAFLLCMADELPVASVTALVGVTGEKLNNKRVAGEGVRENTEQCLAALVRAVPTVCRAFDPGRSSTWRILSHCASAVRYRAVQLTLASALEKKHAGKLDPVQLLEVISTAAAPDLQLYAAAALLTAHSDNVALAKGVATTLVRHKKVALATATDNRAELEVNTLFALVDLCNVAASQWHGQSRSVAETVWQSLEQVSFAVPHFVRRGLYHEAASIMHRAHGHPHLVAHSFVLFAHQIGPLEGDFLTDALDNAVGVDVLRSHHTINLLEARIENSPSATQRATDIKTLEKLRSHLSRCVEQDKSWSAIAATQALLRWAAKADSLEDFFVADSKPGPQLDQFLVRVAQRQAHSRWHRAELPMRRLTSLLQRDADRCERVADALLVSLTSELDRVWTSLCLSLPVVDAILCATHERQRRRELADKFSDALGLWPIVRGDNGKVTRGAVTDNWLAARAEAAYTLLPASLGMLTRGNPSPTSFVHPLEGNRRRARLEAALIHILRAPVHSDWRTARLLSQVLASNVLPDKEVHSCARSAMCLVVGEGKEDQSNHDRLQVINGAVDTIRSVGRAEPNAPELALALLDGLVDALELSDDRAQTFNMMHPLLRLHVESAPESQDGKDAQLYHRLMRRMWERTLQAKILVRERPGQARAVAGVIRGDGAVMALKLALNTWLEFDTSTETFAAHYRSLAIASGAQNETAMVDGAALRPAIVEIGYACIDPELRDSALRAMAAGGVCAPALNGALLLEIARRRPFTGAEVASAAHIAGAEAVMSWLTGAFAESKL